MSTPLATIIMIFIKYSPLVMKFQLFLTHGIFKYNNHNIGKVENDTFRWNSLHSDFLVGGVTGFRKGFYVFGSEGI
jgi:hypothetical protein